MIIKKIPLSELCVTITDGAHSSPKSVEEDTYKIASVKDIKGTDVNLQSCKNISKHDFEVLKKNGCVPQAGDILVGKDGANFFEDIIVFRDQKNIGLLSSIAIIRVDKEKVDPKFLYYYFKQPKVRKDVRENYGSGSAIPRMILKDFKRLPVELPELEHQKEIVNILSPFDDKIEVNNKIINNLENLMTCLFYEKCIKEHDRKTSLSKIANFLNGLAMQKYPPTTEDESLPVLKIRELRQTFCDDNSDLCSSKINPQYIVNDGDLIFSWSGSLLVDIWSGGKCGLNQHLFKVTSKTHPKWFVFLWIKFHIDKFIAIAQAKATTMGHIKRNDLDKAEVIHLDDKEIDVLGKIFKPQFDLLISLKIQNKALAKIRDLLLPKLLSGEIYLSN